jgi:hypothetical protein
MVFLPTVIRAESRGEYRIHLVFNDRVENTVDFSAWLEGRVFEPLRDQEYFRRLFVEGGAVTWPNGADIGVSAHCVHGFGRVMLQNLESGANMATTPLTLVGNSADSRRPTV